MLAGLAEVQQGCNEWDQTEGFDTSEAVFRQVPPGLTESYEKL